MIYVLTFDVWEYSIEELEKMSDNELFKLYEEDKRNIGCWGKFDTHKDASRFFLNNLNYDCVDIENCFTFFVEH